MPAVGYPATNTNTDIHCVHEPVRMYVHMYEYTTTYARPYMDVYTQKRHVQNMYTHMGICVCVITYIYILYIHGSRSVCRYVHTHMCSYVYMYMSADV